MTAPPRMRPTDQALSPDGITVDHADQETAKSTEQKLSLSATQVMASMAAAVTAALVGSRLGVAGTVIGAGLASVISVVGGAVIGHSILLTRTRVKRAVLQVRGADPESAVAIDQCATVVLPAASARDDDYTTVIPAVTRLDLQRASQGTRPGPFHGEPGRPRPTRRPGFDGATGPGVAAAGVPARSARRMSTGVLLGVAASLAIFVSALGAVTVFETIKGSPLSGGESGGLSVLGGNGGNPVDAPVTSTAVVQSTVTQTVTSEVTASAATAQSPATRTSAQSPAAQASAQPSTTVAAGPAAASSTPAPASAGGTPPAAQDLVAPLAPEPTPTVPR